MVDIRLFRSASFGMGNLAGLMSSMGRGGLQFMLIIWLQGIWLPLHGYSFESTPLWGGASTCCRSRSASWWRGLSRFAVGSLRGAAVHGRRDVVDGGDVRRAADDPGELRLLVCSPCLFFLNGLGGGIFTAPNTAAIMSSVPASQRGAASGVRATFFNAGSSLSIGVFFSLMIVGLAKRCRRR